jgi:hypothetical protein
MNRDTIFDELRRLEGEIVKAERRLAEQEALLLKLKREGENVSAISDALNLMREQQQSRQHDRLRLLPLAAINARRVRLDLPTIGGRASLS